MRDDTDHRRCLRASRARCIWLRSAARYPLYNELTYEKYRLVPDQRHSPWALAYSINSNLFSFQELARMNNHHASFFIEITVC